MVTSDGRFEYFKQSYKCFLDQTYSNRELLIVNDGSREYQEQIRSYVGDAKNVILVFLKGKFTLGALRNISIYLAEGELFLQWDDDDFSSPDRIMFQYNWLSRHPKHSVCYLSDQLHYFFPSKQLYWEDWKKWASAGGLVELSLIPGTIMAYKRNFEFRYPSAGKYCAAGEDSVLSNDICSVNPPLLLSGIGHMNVYSYHGKNVWHLEHHLGITRHRSKPVAEMLACREKIIESLNYFNFDTDIQVMGREGLAFVYQK